MRQHVFLPKLWTSLRGYRMHDFWRDAMAGLVVAVIGIPLSIALSIASGMTPEQGLITAFVGGFIVSAFGGSRVQIAGPSGAFVVIVVGLAANYGLAGVLTCMFLAGVILMLMGLFRMGDLIRYIPFPVTTGYTNAVAALIFSTQIDSLLGLRLANIPSDFLPKWGYYLSHLGNTHLPAVLVAGLTLVVMIALGRFLPKIPGTLVAIAVATAVVFFAKLDVDTIGSTFGMLKPEIPAPIVPELSWSHIGELIGPAFAMAMLIAIESLLSAVVSDGMINGNHRSNTELIALGAANSLTAMFGGIPLTGAIARTAASIKAGARTPIAGICSALFIFVFFTLLTPLLAYVPMPALAAVLVMVSYNMTSWSSFSQLPKAPKSDAAVFLLTFVLALFFDVIMALEVGVILSMFLFMKRMAEMTGFHYMRGSDLRTGGEKEPESIGFRIDPEAIGVGDEVDIYEIKGPFFFGAASIFLDKIKMIEKAPKVLILKMTEVPVIDASGYYSLTRLLTLIEKYEMRLLVCELQASTRATLEKFGFFHQIGHENVYPTLEEAFSSLHFTTEGK
ncbi:MAG: SulP family inorganic anion transporter [Bacillota bacterium]|nr:SulP family inorganic anion transporter [Bacillota bacterium]